jgi:hypothetical protein
MNITKIAIATGVAAVAIGTYVWSEGTVHATIDRFPDVDPKVARKVYWKVMREVAKGSFGDVSNYSVEQMDSIFMTVLNDGHRSK